VWLPAKATNRDYALSVLGYTVISCINLAKVNLIPSCDEGIEQIEKEIASSSGKEALDVFKYESFGFSAGNDIAEGTNQCITRIVLLT
jgi:hypothetical protein